MKQWIVGQWCQFITFPVKWRKERHRRKVNCWSCNPYNFCLCPSYCCRFLLNIALFQTRMKGTCTVSIAPYLMVNSLRSWNYFLKPTQLCPLLISTYILGRYYDCYSYYYYHYHPNSMLAVADNIFMFTHTHIHVYAGGIFTVQQNAQFLHDNILLRCAHMGGVVQ